jgi:hypothetical protein
MKTLLLKSPFRAKQWVSERRSKKQSEIEFTSCIHSKLLTLHYLPVLIALGAGLPVLLQHQLPHSLLPHNPSVGSMLDLLWLGGLAKRTQITAAKSYILVWMSINDWYTFEDKIRGNYTAHPPLTSIGRKSKSQRFKNWSYMSTLPIFTTKLCNFQKWHLPQRRVLVWLSTRKQINTLVFSGPSEHCFIRIRLHGRSLATLNVYCATSRS